MGLYISASAPWRSDLVSEMMSFPVGDHDDQVDALGLAGQLLDKMLAGREAKDEKKPVQPTGTVVLQGAPKPQSKTRIRI